MPFDQALEKIKARYFGADDQVQTDAEVDFLTPILYEVESVVEIGAGYGRTANAILKANPKINYTIIDREPALSVAKTWLSSQGWQHISFKDRHDNLNWPISDLTIAISVLSELDETEAGEYMGLVKYGKYFYLKDVKEVHAPREINMEKYNIPPQWKIIKQQNLPRGFVEALYRIT